MLSHHDAKNAFCVYTDASDAYWSGVVKQCHPKNLDMNVEEKWHEPIAFLGAALKRPEKWWTTFEKEAFAINQVLKKMDYLMLAEEKAHIHTDHRNLFFVFNPLALDSTLGKHIVNKVQLWGLYLSKVSYVVENIDGEKNVMADIITRWWRGYRGKRQTVKRITHLLLERDTVEPPFAKDFERPTVEAIQASRHEHKEDAQEENTNKTNGS